MCSPVILDKLLNLSELNLLWLSVTVVPPCISVLRLNFVGHIHMPRWDAAGGGGASSLALSGLHPPAFRPRFNPLPSQRLHFLQTCSLFLVPCSAYFHLLAFILVPCLAPAPPLVIHSFDRLETHFMPSVSRSLFWSLGSNTCCWKSVFLPLQFIASIYTFLITPSVFLHHINFHHVWCPRMFTL